MSQELVDNIKNGRTVVFLGAGWDAACGFPSCSGRPMNKKNKGQRKRESAPTKPNALQPKPGTNVTLTP